MQLGKVGVWLGSVGMLPAAEERDAVRRLEAAGYGTLWYGESPRNREAFVHAALLLAATEHAAVASGILNILLRHPTATANGAAALGEAYPDRFVLGLGVSHRPTAVSLHETYGRPLAQMRAYLDAMEGGVYQVASPPEPVPVVLAALGPRMLELARDRTQGAHPYLTTPEHTALAREILGPGSLLAPEQSFVLETDAGRARTIAREHLSRYLKLENYANNWRRLGFSEDDVAGEGSDRLVDALVAWGDVDAVAARVRAHLDAGADHVCVQALGPDPVGQLLRVCDDLRSLR